MINCDGLFICEDSKSVPYKLDLTNKVIICGVPGAFTPGCTRRHLPEFAENLQLLKDRGIGKIVFVSVNDAWVMEAWNSQHGSSEIDSVGDPLGKFVSNIGEFVDKGETLGSRCNRFAILVENGFIIHKFQDPFFKGVIETLPIILDKKCS